jgi:hypothetical protein
MEDAMRVRQHYFRADGAGICGFDIDNLRVGQLAEEIGLDGTSEESHCDTIEEDNPALPFWPYTPANAKQMFSHRCSVHSVNGGLEWSDWPQVSVSDPEARSLIWRFVTGVFRRHTADGIVEYDLVARTAWEVNWARSG